MQKEKEWKRKDEDVTHLQKERERMRKDEIVAHMQKEREREEEKGRNTFFWILSSNFLGPSHRQLVYTIRRFFRNFRSFISRVSSFFFLFVCFFCFSFTFSFVLLYTEELSLSNFLHGRNLCANERSRPSPRCRRALSQISAARSQYCSNKEDTF